MNTINIILIVFMAVVLVVCAVTLFIVLRAKKITLSQMDKQEISNSLSNQLNISNNAINLQLKTFQDVLNKSQKDLEDRVQSMTKTLDDRMQKMSEQQEQKLENIRLSNERNIKSLQEDNNKQLDKMRETVDEKLSKTINERFEQTFKVLNDQLEKVYKSIGEMQNMATDVGSLTKMLSNVKTTGIFGEIQLGAILEQILNNDQYETNIITGDSREPVEYAIKLPGSSDGEFVYMPIDSKFPYTVYSDLQNAYEANDFDQVKAKKEQLKATIKNMAKDICTKYICPPKTTDFAVMFLPVEGLYAEVVKMGLLTEIQNKYKVTIAGPTTMSALLNSLQMGFRTLAIQKKSGEVWKILSAVKTEFDKFGEIMEKIQNKLESTSKDFDMLIGTRSRMIMSKLKSVEKIESVEAKNILNLPNSTDDDQDKE